MNIDLDSALKKVSAIKLPGGVVGKVSSVLIVITIIIGSIAVLSKNEWVMGGGIAAIFILAFPMLWRLINFADRNPQAALLEGGEFILHQQIIMGSKMNPAIPLNRDAMTEERAVNLTAEEQTLLNQPEDAQLSLPADSVSGRQ